MGIGCTVFGTLSAMFYKRPFCDFVYFPVLQIPSANGVYSKRKEFAPKGSKFFPFRIDTFSERKTNQHNCLLSNQIQTYHKIGRIMDAIHMNIYIFSYGWNFKIWRQWSFGIFNRVPYCSAIQRPLFRHW